MEKYGRQQAQYGEAEEREQVRRSGVAGGCDQHQHCQRAGVPQKRQTGGGHREPASAQARSRTVAEQQVEEDAEDDRSGGMTQCVDKLRLVDERHE